MIVIGVDTHKRQHTLVALDAATGAASGRADTNHRPGEADLLGFSSAGAGTRTQALRIKSPLLYQLSYAGLRWMMAAARELRAPGRHRVPARRGPSRAGHRRGTGSPGGSAAVRDELDLDQHARVDQAADLHHRGDRTHVGEDLTVGAPHLVGAGDVGDVHARLHHVGGGEADA